MAEFKDYATPNQLKAVENRGHDILVSASAGSGKTKVLVERIKDEIINENATISRMLIMTFTNAAAKEMKDRLTKVLQAELNKQMTSANKNPQKISHLQRQLTAINVADISTIDSFCLKFLKKYYYAIKLDPNFRVLADDTERDVLREDVWQKVREDFYQTYEDLLDTPELNAAQQKRATQYRDLLQLFTADRRDDDLTEVVYKLNDFASANENPEEWLAQAPQNYDFETETFTQTKIYQQVLKKSILNQLQSALESFQAFWNDFINEQVPLMQEYYSEKEKKVEKLMAKVDADEIQANQQISTLQTLIEQIQADQISWDDLRKEITELFEGKAKRYAKKTDFPDDEAVIERFDQMKQQRATAQKIIIDLQTSYFIYNDQQLKVILKRAKGVVELLVELVQKFRDEYLQTKLNRHALEFSDLEYFTLKILRGNTETQQKIREELKTHYTEIMLDEYQDTNGVQEAIVQAIANHNVFMVGDVKQSIYRFRQADPGLFMRKYRQFKTSEMSTDLTNGELIVLQENFRSIRNIADLTNLIFMQIMDQNLGEIDYDQQAFLKAENPAYKTGFEDISADTLIYLSDQPDDSEVAFQLDSKTQGQFVIIANKIKQMMDDGVEIFDRELGQRRKLQFSDIAILSSSHQDSLLVNAEFKRLGIPTDVDETNNYFKTTEIQIMISLLKIIDNPHQDIPLVAVLRSPMYNFDENELAYIRINHQHGDFFSALTDFQGKYQTNPDALKPYDQEKITAIYEKVTQFTNDLTTFRVQGKRSNIATLIWNIYTTTGFLDFVGGMPGGAQRQANLHALYERATAYEKTSFKGLFQFIRFIERLDQQQKDLPEMKLQTDNDAVKFMTIHKSKGLEFPVVFVTDLSKKFNLQDMNKKYILDDQLGIGIEMVESSKETLKRDANVEIREDEAVEIRETTPISLAIKDQIKRKSLAEEMRKLYVALTRAEQKIFLVGSYSSVDKWAQAWNAAKQNSSLVIAENYRLDRTNFMDWIGQALSRQPGFLDHTKVYDYDNQKRQIIEQSISAVYDQTDKYFTVKSTPTEIKDNQLNYRIELWTSKAVGMQREKEDVETQSVAETIESDEISQTLNTDAKTILDFVYPNQSLTKEPAYQAVTDIKRLFDDPDNDNMTTLDANHLKEKQMTISSFAFNKPEFLTTTVAVSPAEIGTATHLLFQKIDLNKAVSIENIQAKLNELVLEGSISEAVAKQIDLVGVAAFYQTDLGKIVLANAKNVKREAPFSLLLPASMLAESSEENQDKKVLVHGIIDGYVVDETTGEVYLFDYKTDKTSLKQIKQSYQGQLNLYAAALKQITGKEIQHSYLYAVKHQKLIDCSKD